jgi:hypothetical protein
MAQDRRFVIDASVGHFECENGRLLTIIASGDFPKRPIIDRCPDLIAGQYDFMGRFFKWRRVPARRNRLGNWFHGRWDEEFDGGSCIMEMLFAGRCLNPEFPWRTISVDWLRSDKSETWRREAKHQI